MKECGLGSLEHGKESQVLVEPSLLEQFLQLRTVGPSLHIHFVDLLRDMQAPEFNDVGNVGWCNLASNQKEPNSKLRPTHL